MAPRRLSPSRSLQKLRTAFTSHSPTRRTDSITTSASPTPLSPTTSATSTSPSTTTSPSASQQPTFAGFSFGFGATSPLLSSSPSSSATDDLAFPDSRRVIRRKKSCVEIEQEQERWQFDGALVGIVEPRPRVGPALGGIEEVLCGEV